LSRALFLLGAVPFLFLGAAHAFATPLRTTDRRGLSPSDPELAKRMSEARVRLTGRTDMWLAWVGFHLSHSLGAVVFGVFVVMLGWDAASFAKQASTFVPFSCVVAAIYLYLGTRYWFRTPIIGCAFSVACFVSSWLAL
jgi:hypothetical protein